MAKLTRTLRVLVADDDPLVLKLMDKYLQDLGCQVVLSRNGKEAVEEVRATRTMGTTPFDICFMDLMMPEMGGIEAVLIMREELGLKAPVVAITSSTMKATKEKCFDVGMIDFVAKPVSAQIVAEMIETHVLNVG